MYNGLAHPNRKAVNSVNDFRNCLKFELIEYCKENDLPTHGSKKQIRERIEIFLNKQLKNDRSSNSLKNKRRIIRKINININ
ncbi:SAP domain-containing protein [Winogradskyella psychrotolerans]|uniref:SAP domain-containing protein n=1 Tax=Winogradskyella psychrotolerans TaxID=1344585 RepID=UPI00339D6A34